MFDLTKETNLKINFPDGTNSKIDTNVEKLINHMQNEILNNQHLPFFYNFKKSADQYSEIFLKFYSYLILNHNQSMTELYQDLFVLFCLDQKVKGKFLEFTKNYDCSNSLLLEKKFDWEGVLVSSSNEINKALDNTRPNCKIIDNYFSSNESQSEYMFSSSPALDLQKKLGSKQKFSSINDIFLKYFDESPIDYLSIDTEGSEIKILEELDFQKFAPTIITVKHRFNEQQAMLDILLSQNNYVRFFKEHSQFDAWYVLQL